VRGKFNANSPDGIPQPDLYTGEPPLHSAHKTWKLVQNDLSYALGANIHRAWTGRLRVQNACARTVTLTAPSPFVASKIESSFADTLSRLWKKHDVVAPPRSVIITTRSSTRTSTTQAPVQRPAAPRVNTASAAPQSPTLPPRNNPPDSPRRRFTFDNFVTGPSNELAAAVARQVAMQNFDNGAMPTYNPIVIHGANGMGKTHLLHAVQQTLEERAPQQRVQMLSSEQFVSTFVRSLRKNGRDAIDSFKASLRDVDLLIIDDAHFIADKPGSQEELMMTLIALVDTGRQILLASDRHPDEIEKATPRLKSYLSSGLVCKIGTAEYELRRRILDRLIDRRRAQSNPRLAIPQNARDHIAARINATPRDLEGAFNQVVAQAEFLGTPITLETVQDTLADSRFNAGQRLTVEIIQRVTADIFGITLNDMTSKQRSRNIARPRQVAMYLCKTLTKRSLPDIGRRFGGRDHTTVMHAVKRITDLRKDDPAFDKQVTAVETALKTR